MAKIFILGILFAVFLVVAGLRKGVPDDCPACDEDSCKKPKKCFAGVVKDRCGCCYVCARGEGESCDMDDSRYKYGYCGSRLECRLRNDVDPGLHKATCQCKEQKAVCGSNDVTYDNICQLMADAERKNIDIVRKFKHPCKTVPSIRSPPTNVKNVTSTDVFLSCEATGYPIPTLSWTWSNAEQETFDLPTDDLHVSVNSRGGPERFMITGWLQIMNLQERHQGDYTCKVNNEVGMATAVARVNVVDPSRL